MCRFKAQILATIVRLPRSAMMKLRISVSRYTFTNRSDAPQQHADQAADPQHRIATRAGHAVTKDGKLILAGSK